MTTPVKVFGEYVVCFSQVEEWTSMRQHFIKECGWTESQFRKIKDYDWFTCEISIWKDGVELATEYLGACCYKKAEEFYTTYACDYFSDMVDTCAMEIDDAVLIAQVDAWRAALDAEKVKHLEKMLGKKTKKVAA